ncbi:MAG: hypothetical protein JNK82_38450 [Myxococcaceae bacterium]|nr:hypothetical protein [Myxococcaceae bacterium]
MRALFVMLALTLAAEAEPPVRGLTPRRAVASGAALVALAACVTGALALRRPARRRAHTALTLGALSVTTGTFVVVTAPGGFGSGGGLAGGIAAIALGLGGAALGQAARRRA